MAHFLGQANPARLTGIQRNINLAKLAHIQEILEEPEYFRIYDFGKEPTKLYKKSMDFIYVRDMEILCLSENLLD